ncbi:MAG: RNA polymerase sigma-70 factor [Bacteroidetes bacterium]|nr:RNA polymerase sigma-70 factor [Bacteroidota bacterium]
MSEQATYDEKRLLLDLAAGDENAYKSMYQQYGDAVFKLAIRYVKSEALAQDLTQDVFIKIWEKRERLTEVQYFQAYLLQVARNESINLLRAVGKSDIAKGEIARHFHANPGFFEDETLQRDYREFIKRTLDSLSPRSREIFILCREQGKTYDEVAAELGISRNVVRKHMVSSLQKFRDAAQDELGTPLGLVLLILIKKYF